MSQQAVDAKFTIVCGKRGGGKTNKTIRQLFKSVSMGKKVLVFDVKNEFGDYLLNYPDHRISIKPMAKEFVPRFSVSRVPEIRRLVPFAADNSPLTPKELIENLIFVLKNFRGGGLVLLTEDLSAIMNDSVPADVYGALATLRQAGVDVVAHFQMVGKAAHPKMMAMANYIRLYKTEDNVKMHRENFQDKLEIMLLAEKIVERRYRWGMQHNINDQTGKFFNVTVDVDYSKIRGIFTKPEAEKAVAEYLSEQGEVDKLLKSKDRSGKKIYSDYEKAFSHLEQKLMADYFDFKG